MLIHFEQEYSSSVQADALVLFVTKAQLEAQTMFALLEKQTSFSFVEYFKRVGFEGKLSEAMVVPINEQGIKTLLCIGAGCDDHVDEDKARKLGAFTGKQLKQLKAKRVCVLFQGAPQFSETLYVQSFIEGLMLSRYHYIACKGEEALHEQSKQISLEDVCLVLDQAHDKDFLQQQLPLIQALVNGVFLTRDLVNAPSNRMGPAEMALAAETLVTRHPEISLTILDREVMEHERMWAALSVADGSEKEPKGIHLLYKPKKAKKKVVIVGKAVTFDSGGLSLKPADGMMTMKMDMAGAAAVLGLFEVLPTLKLDLEVHGLFLAVENMPSGSAYRPGDVICARNGKAIEVLNTDAEGRVTLADALSYASDLKPDYLIDLATLTGAAIVALGEEIAAVLSTDKKLTAQLMAASEGSGEMIWELPMHKTYADLIKSKIGDIKNIGGKPAGVITAALFLKEFVGKDIAWAHLDIAGPAYAEKETRPDIPYGGTGFGVRLLARYLQALSKEE